MAQHAPARPRARTNGKVALRLPEQPRLAPGIRLAGQMQESAFQDPPWLLEREGADFSQVTRLLYLIAERCDGRHTLDQIAADVSEQYGRRVSADNVRQLATTQLLAHGFLASADGKMVTTPAGAGRSMLNISLRSKEIGPQTIDRVTRFFTWLYWPPILVVALLAVGAAEAWLYFVHGVGGSLHDALYTPGLMLIVLFAMVVGAAIHEIGHASALRYGGGQVRGMGAGFYLMYPAFYTDVTDNYRLKRWARIRTDTGGFYFNLLTALALTGIYALARAEFLLLVIVLINFEIVHQLLPLIRLDGYWILADLTGIPDFFSQMKPFLRSLLPLPWWKGRKLPPLKSWGKGVFLLYILVAIPFLLFSLFLMIKGVPRVLATAWDSALKQQAAFGRAQASGDLLRTAGAVGQMLVLCIPTFGVLFTLYRLGKAAIRAVWNWSKPTPARRAAGGLGTLAVFALLFSLWAPQLPFAGPQPNGARSSGPLYNAAAVNFVPIQPNERGAVQDVLRNTVVTVPGRPTPEGTPLAQQGTPPAQTTRTAQSTPTAAGTLSATAPSATTPAPGAPAPAFTAPTAPALRAAAPPTVARPAGATAATTAPPIATSVPTIGSIAASSLPGGVPASAASTATPAAASAGNTPAASATVVPTGAATVAATGVSTTGAASASSTAAPGATRVITPTATLSL